MKQINNMTKITEAKRQRMFDWSKDKGFHKRQVILPPLSRRSLGDCGSCHLPVMAAQGQSVNGFKQRDGTFVPIHKACSKKRWNE